jgi:protein-L-isoaspartate(D-aspartate) O-methyltransferase
VRPADPEGDARRHDGRPVLAGLDGLAGAVRAAGIRDERLLEAIADVPRADFVPAGRLDDACRDVPVPIPHDQVTTQPSLVAAMVQSLELSGAERVLEVGTGYGWQTALLARLAAEVWSVERFADVAERAAAALLAAGARNANVVVGDGSEGLAERAPYDAVIVAAAYRKVPAPLAAQLSRDGRLVQPIGEGGNERVTLFRRGERGLVRVRTVIGAHFVRLYGRHGF